MKREKLLKHLRRYGGVSKREGSKYSLWMNLNNGEIEAIPRHVVLPDKLVKKICRRLGIPDM